MRSSRTHRASEYVPGLRRDGVVDTRLEWRQAEPVLTARRRSSLRMQGRAYRAAAQEDEQVQVSILIQILDADAREMNGQYVVEYDPSRPGMSPAGDELIAHLVVTADRDQAKRFADTDEAMNYYRQSYGWRPEDGEVNRPLTSFCVGLVGYLEDDENDKPAPDPDDHRFRAVRHRGDRSTVKPH